MAKGVDPTRFPDMTYPYLIAILTDEKAGKGDDQAVRAKQILKDFRGGKYNATLNP